MFEHVNAFNSINILLEIFTDAIGKCPISFHVPNAKAKNNWLFVYQSSSIKINLNKNYVSFQ